MNPNHDPANGQFSDGLGGAGTGDKTTDSVLKYSNELKANIQNNAAFDKTVERLGADKSVRTEEMRQIAKAHLGYDIKASHGRAAALQKIKDDQMVAMRQAGRAANIGKMKSW